MGMTQMNFVVMHRKGLVPAPSRHAMRALASMEFEGDDYRELQSSLPAERSRSARAEDRVRERATVLHTLIAQSVAHLLHIHVRKPTGISVRMLFANRFAANRTSLSRT